MFSALTLALLPRNASLIPNKHLRYCFPISIAKIAKKKDKASLLSLKLRPNFFTKFYLL